MQSWSGVAYRSVAGHCVSVRVYCGGCLKRLSCRCFVGPVGCLPRAFSGSSSGQRLLCILGVRLRMASWLWLGSVRLLSSFSPPSSPYSGKQGLLLNSFSIELTVQCDGCLIWGLGWRPGLVAGLRLGQAYGVFHRPGFGLLVSVPRSLSTQPLFVTKALKVFYAF